MTPTHTRKGGKLYRYYVSTDVLKRDADACTVRRVPAAEIESAVIDQVRGLLRSPEIIVRTWRAARQSIDGLNEAEVREALQRLDPLWDELFPAEQARIVQLLVERVDVSPDGADIRLRTEGLANLTADLDAVRPEAGGRRDGQAEDQRATAAPSRCGCRFRSGSAAAGSSCSRPTARTSRCAPVCRQHRQRHGQGDRPGVPLARDVGTRRVRHGREIADAERSTNPMSAACCD